MTTINKITTTIWISSFRMNLAHETEWEEVWEVEPVWEGHISAPFVTKRRKSVSSMPFVCPICSFRVSQNTCPVFGGCVGLLYK